jgi:hypothetical protein
VTGLFAACCVDAFLCAAECETNDCVEECMDDAGPTARQQMIALAVCSEESSCDAAPDRDLPAPQLPRRAA